MSKGSKPYKSKAFLFPKAPNLIKVKLVEAPGAPNLIKNKAF
jgi:hypothetical protein